MPAFCVICLLNAELSINSSVKVDAYCWASLCFVLGNAESQSIEVVNRVRVDYEKKLGELQSELRKLEVAKMEHAKMLKSQALYEKQCRDLQRDLSEMKKMKVHCIYGVFCNISCNYHYFRLF